MNNENKIFKIIKRIYRGACYSEKHGSHPGTGILIAMILMGAVAGASNESFNPAIGAIFGSAIMALWTVPIWLAGQDLYTMSQCIRCRITGHVQGVWFRGSTQQQAVRLGLTGYAKNLTDGSVEVVACGEEAAIAQLHEWLWQGPRGASVIGVACEPLAESGCYSSFTTA